MTVKTDTQPAETKTVVDDLGDQTVNMDKLAALKAKMAKKEDTVPPRIVAKKTRSIRVGVVGTGQGGSRLAEAFHALGYEAVCFNTATQDLVDIKLPEANKFLLDFSLGGAAKDLSLGAAAAEAHKEAISELVNDKLGECQLLLLTSSLGGGSGAGSLETMVDVLSATGKPVVMMTALPMENEDAQTKQNALETLAKLSKEVQNKRISNLFVVDNAKIESIYSDVSQMDFFEVANKAIVEPLDAFNTYSAMPSPLKALDSMEFAKILTDGEGLSLYGSMTVPNYEEDTAIAEAVINNLSQGLLASGFDLKQSKYVGVMVIANKEVWSKIPSSSVNYAMALIEEACGVPEAVFKGVYQSEEVTDDVVKVYSMFSGLGLPDSRVSQLKKDVHELTAKAKEKTVARNLTLNLDTGTEQTVSAAQKIKEKIAAQSSTFGKFTKSVVVDKRKK